MGILLLCLILFGAKKLPELAKGLGSGIKEFKKATRDVQDDLHRALDEDQYHNPPPSHPAPPPEPPPADDKPADSGDTKE